jgi:hypothetical protein
MANSVPMAESGVAIERFLKRVKRRRLILELSATVVTSLAIWAILFLPILWAATLEGGSHIARRIALGTLLTGLVTALAFIVTRFRELSDDTRLARLLYHKAPDLGSDLLSAIELEREPLEPAHFSPALHAAMIGRIEHELATIPPTLVAPLSLMRLPTVLLVVALVAWGSSAIKWPRQVPEAFAALLSPRARPTQPSSKPIVADLELVLSYPAHTRRQPRSISGSSGHIVAPAGTRVKLTARPLDPKARMRMQLEQRGAREPLAVAHEKGRIRVSFTVRKRGNYVFLVKQLDKSWKMAGLKRRIRIEVDRAPRAKVLGPEDDLAVAADQVIEVGYLVDDDYGLSAIRLVTQIDRQKPIRRTIWRRPQPTKKGRDRQQWLQRKNGKLELDLDELELSRGGRLAYWIEAVDNDAVNGPKVGRSSALHVRVFSADERHQQTLASQRRVLEHMLKHLSSRLLVFASHETHQPLDLTTLTSTETAPLVNHVRALNKQLAVIVHRLGVLRSQMDKDEQSPVSVNRRISRLRTRLKKAAHKERARLKGLSGATLGKALLPLSKHNKDVVRTVENAVLTMATLIDEQKLGELSDLAEKLRRARQELRTLLERYRKTNDPRLKDQILRRIRAMRRLAAKLMRRASQLSRSIPDEYLNANAVDNLDLGRKLGQLEKMLQSGKVDKLDSALSELDKDLDSLQRMFDNNLGAFRSGHQSAYEKAYSKLLDKLYDAERQQRDIASKTEKIVDNYRQRASQLLQKKLGPQLDAQRSKLSRLRRQMDRLDRAPMAGYQRDQLDRARRHAQLLDIAMRQRDLAQSLQVAKKLNGSLKTLRDDMQGDQLGRLIAQRRGKKRTLRDVRKAQSRAEDIENELEALFPDPRSLLSKQERRQLQALRRQQQSLKKRVEKFSKQKRLGIGGQAFPQAIRRVGKLMGSTSSSLQRQQPQRAHGTALDAAKAMSRIRKSLRRERKSRGSGAQGVRRYPIKIPGVDEFEPPRAFRDAITDAMREAAPERYRRQVRRYYEELVR